MSIAVGNVTLQPESVTPAQINPDSVEVHGTWDNFTVTWHPTPVSIQHVHVFYEVELMYDEMYLPMQVILKILPSKILNTW